MTQIRLVTQEERIAAYNSVFGAAVEANQKYGKRKDGDCYAQQVRTGKTKRDRQNSPKIVETIKPTTKKGKK